MIRKHNRLHLTLGPGHGSTQKLIWTNKIFWIVGIIKHGKCTQKFPCKQKNMPSKDTFS